jgi:AbrB family looped-hinge helix DNA binding protein
MKLMSTITSKGQTTVPKEVRQRLGLGPRQKIVYEMGPEGVSLHAAGSSLSELAGALAGKKPALDKSAERAAYRKARVERYKA